MYVILLYCNVLRCIVLYCRASHTGDAIRVVICIVVWALVLFMCSEHARRCRAQYDVLFIPQLVTHLFVAFLCCWLLLLLVLLLLYLKAYAWQPGAGQATTFGLWCGKIGPRFSAQTQGALCWTAAGIMRSACLYGSSLGLRWAQLGPSWAYVGPSWVSHTDTFAHHTNPFHTHKHAYTQTLLHTDSVPHQHFCTQPLPLLHTDAFAQTLLQRDRDSFTQTLLHTNTFTRKRFYTQTLLHTKTFTYTQTRFHANAFTYKLFYTQTHNPFTQTFLHIDASTDRTFSHTNTFTHKHFYTQMLLHTDAFTHRPFYTQTPFTHKHVCTQTLLHTNACTHTNASTHKRFDTQTLWRTNSFTQKRFYFYTQMLLHTFTHTAKALPPDQPKSQKTFSFWHSNLISYERVAAENVKSQKPSVFDTRTSFRVSFWLDSCERVAAEDV